MRNKLCHQHAPVRRYSNIVKVCQFREILSGKTAALAEPSTLQSFYWNPHTILLSNQQSKFYKTWGVIMIVKIKFYLYMQLHNQSESIKIIFSKKYCIEILYVPISVYFWYQNGSTTKFFKKPTKVFLKNKVLQFLI